MDKHMMSYPKDESSRADKYLEAYKNPSPTGDLIVEYKDLYGKEAIGQI